MTEGRTCLDCPTSFEGEHLQRLRCEPCAVMHRRRYNTSWRRQRRTDSEFRAQENARRRTPEHRAKERERQKTPQYLAQQRARWRERYHHEPGYRERRLKQSRDRKRERYATEPEYREHAKVVRRLRKPWDETVTPESIADLLERQRGRCRLCDVDIRDGYHLDHVLPMSKGGPSTLTNLQLLCGSCNGRKHDHLAAANADGQMVMSV